MSARFPPLLLALALLPIAAWAESFYLTDEAGKRHGPFTLAENARVELEGKAYVLHRARPEENPLVVKMKGLVLPAVEFQDAPVADVLAALSSRSRELDVKDKSGVRIVYTPAPAKPGAPPAKGLSFRLKQVSVHDVLQMVCLSAGLDWEIRDNAVVVRPVSGT